MFFCVFFLVMKLGIVYSEIGLLLLWWEIVVLRETLSLSCSLTFLAIIIFLKLRAQQTRQLDCARAKPTEQTTKSLGLEIMGRLVGRAPVPVQSGRRLRARRRKKEARQTIYAAVVWGSVRRADSGESSEVNLEVNLGSIVWEFVFWLRRRWKSWILRFWSDTTRGQDFTGLSKKHILRSFQKSNLSLSSFWNLLAFFAFLANS